MAKKNKKTSADDTRGRDFTVYQQTDGALVVLPASDSPEDDNSDLIDTVTAVNEREAIDKVRKTYKWLRKAPVANLDHDPETNTDVQRETERRVNKRLGITARPGKATGATKSAKSGVKKKGVTKAAKKPVAKKKAARR